MKIKKIELAIAVVALLGVAGGAYVVGANNTTKNVAINHGTKSTVESSAHGSRPSKSSEDKDADNSVNKNSESSGNVVSESTSKSSSYSVASSFSASGELAESASEMSSVMTADSGVPITDEMIKEARASLEKQGVSSGPFSDLEMAKIINIANEQSLDYKSAIKVLYPNYFE